MHFSKDITFNVLLKTFLYVYLFVSCPLDTCFKYMNLFSEFYSYINGHAFKH